MLNNISIDGRGPVMHYSQSKFAFSKKTDMHLEKQYLKVKQ